MTHDELMKMTKAQLNARLKEIGAAAKTAEGEALDALLAESEDIADILHTADARAKLAEMAKGAEEPKNAEKADDTVKAFTDRGEQLKKGSSVEFSARIAARRIRNSLSVTSTAPVVHTAEDVRDTFNPVSALVDMVKIVPLMGGETYERDFVKGYGTGAATDENEDYNVAEPQFGYVTVEKQKITAYAEEPEEMQKLPNADYDGIVEESVSKAVRRYLSRQIMIGDGSTAKLKGIFFNPTKKEDQAIDPSTDITTITAIDDGTLDDIVYSYGGDEEVESVATLILNKKDLKAFAKLRDKQGRKVYTIVNNGNSGTIDGVPFIINSACSAVSDSATAAGAYEMAYGPLENFELAIFSDIDVRRSDDYKFKQGQTAFRASIFAGGAVAAYNGFVRVKKASA